MSAQHPFLVGEVHLEHVGFTAVGVDHLGAPAIAVPILARIWAATTTPQIRAVPTGVHRITTDG
jgi:hypothetical protein